MKDSPGSWPERTNAEYEHLAADMVAAFNDKNTAALRRLNEQYGRDFDFDDLGAEIWRRVYAFRQRASDGTPTRLEPAEAQMVVAQDAGYGSWQALLEAAEGGAPRVPAFAIDTKERRIAPRRQLADGEWDELIAAADRHGVTSVATHGMINDAVLARLAALEQVTELSLAGARQVSDAGLQSLAHMPQLRALELTGTRISDAGLAVLSNLPELRRLQMSWLQTVSDAGLNGLRSCDRLESVDLMGSSTGDGAIAALQGKTALRHFSSGRQLTDRGLALLRGLPRFARLQADDDTAGAVACAEDHGAHLLIDGPFTDGGLAGLAGLEGVVALDLFWHATGITPAGFAHLADLPNLRYLGADGERTDDEALRHIAAIPELRQLRAQECGATDDGFEALSGSSTLEGLWGRECAGFGSRGFVALSRMPALKSLGIGCQRVDDEALATLPHFPSLRELTPIGFTDDGFRHIGRCENLERLTCMYCRTTTDVATEHIADLRLRYYYAGLTQITDRTLQILGRMSSLEQIDLYECNGITDEGIAHLAGLPNLRSVSLDSLPGVTLAATAVFPPDVQVRYST